MAAPGTTFGAFGDHLYLADGANLWSRFARDRLSDRQGQMRSRDHRILTIGHRRRSGVVGKTEDLCLIPSDRHDALDDADSGRRAFERAALLDMELEVAVPRALVAPCLHDAIGIAAYRADRVRPPYAVPHLVHVIRRDVARDDTAARQSAVERDTFLGGPDDHFERMARPHAGSVQRIEHTDGRQRSEITVEVPSCRNRIDMRAEEDGRKRGICPRPAGEDVTCGIDPGCGPGGAQQVGHVTPAGDVRFGIGDAAHTILKCAPAGPSEHAQRLEPRSKCAGID